MGNKFKTLMWGEIRIESFLVVVAHWQIGLMMVPSCRCVECAATTDDYYQKKRK